MADSDINGLTQATTNYVDETDELIVQKSGEADAKKVQVNDLFGGWRDMIAPLVGARLGGVTDPVFAPFGPSGGIKAFKFGIGDELFLTMHVDHDMKQSATMYPHVHWATDGTDTGNVQWEIEYMIAAGHDQANFGAPSIITVEQAAAGTAWRHMVTEDAVGVATPEPDSLILVHVTRIAASTNECTDDVFGLTLDWHYPTQMYATKNRAPNFYV